jgi:predicted HicB family RNase H-like nuclease
LTSLDVEVIVPIGMTVSRQKEKLSISRRVTTRRTSLSLPDGISLSDWRNIGVELFLIADASAWWLGDWLIYGQHAYPSRYIHAIEQTELSYQTLRNYAWVARKFDVSRRRDKLSIQHHAEVAALSERDQDIWLDQAELHGWSVATLRKQLKAARSVNAEPKSETFEILQIKVDSKHKERLEEAAKKSGCDLTEWILATVDDAVDKILAK